MAVDTAAFRQVMSLFPTGITVVTTAAGEEIQGLTVNAFCSVSLQPPLVLCCLNNEGYCRALLTRSQVFAVNFLGEEQEALACRFSTLALSPRERFEGIPYHTEVTGAPVLDEAVGWLDCRVEATYPGGDHTIVLGEILALGHASQAKPLVFYRSRYHRGDMSCTNGRR